ncbi:Speckle-type POZ protein [Araneus ventricosus]|uniref:Speckle-type POZ protein n=1 Tax=Araneus ventricosus TaxID=182803 RepID=A0A4Y2LP26_ARAVE|nr:Speckle-type POZ protein [Araneus ventricosus]
MKEFIFTWGVENISYSWHKTGEEIVSPTFCAAPLQNTAWTLKLYPRGRDNSDYLSLYLIRERDQVPINLAVNFELSCVYADTSALHSCFVPETFTTFSEGGYYGFGESCFIKRYEVFGRRKTLYLPQDILTLRCRMWRDEDDDEFGQIFGRTRLTTERIVSVENIYLENLMNKTFNIQSKHQNEALMSVGIVYYDDKIKLGINPISGDMKTFTCKVTFVDKRTGRRLCEHISCFFGRPHSEVWQLPFTERVLPTENDNSVTSNFEILTDCMYSTGEEVKMIEKDCPVRIPEFLSNYIISWVPSVRQADYPSISKDLWALYNDQILCDVELKTQTKSFFVHEVVLCARSPVFLAMLTREMKEKINKYIEIEDISADTLEKFLAFLYTDAFEDLEWDAVAEVYYAADKYQVERLKFLCRSYFLKNDDFDNVCELLILADRHQDCELKRKAHDYIWRNEEKVFRSSTWKKFADEQPQLAMKTMLSKYEEKDNQSPAETIDDSITNHPSMLDDFGSLYQGQIINDIVIKSKSTTFPAHTTVLCASSPTFKDMFTRICDTNKKIKSTDFFEIEDLEDDTVSQLLLFLYADSLEDVQWDTAKKLYHAAGVYQIRRLQFKCSCFLLENLKVSNACDLLLFAHEQRDVQLKLAVEDFIHMYDEEIFGSDEWAALGEANIRLAFDTMCVKYKK